MRKLSRSLVFLCCLCSFVYAKSDSSRFELGPSMLAGTSIFAGNAPDGIESNPEAAYGFGIMNILHGRQLDDFSLIIGMAFESRAISFSPKAYEGPEQTVRMNYISVQTGMKVHYFLLTAAVGIPVSGKETFEPAWIYTTEQNPDPVEIHSREMDFSVKDILLDLRLGILVPILTFGTQHLDAHAQVSYEFGDLRGNRRFLIPASQETLLESPILSIQAGLSYFFSIQ